MRVWTADLDAILVANYGTASYAQIGVMLGLKASAVKARARRLQLTKYTAGRHPLSRGNNRKYGLNHDFFSVASPLAAYWAGFIAADGCIINEHRISINLSSRDHAHLARFVSDIEFTGHITERRQQSYSLVHIAFSSRKCVRDLLAYYSITPRKSLTIAPPTIDAAPCITAFIIGYIDGNGCIRMEKGRTTAGVIERPTMSITTGSPAMAQWLGARINRLLNDDRRRVYQKRTNVWNVIVTGRALLELSKVLAAVDVPRLERKWDVLEGLEVPTHGMTVAGKRRRAPIRKLSARARDEIMALARDGAMTYAEIGRRFNVTGARVGQIAREDRDDYVDAEEIA